MNYEVSMYLNGPNYSFYHPRSVGYTVNLLIPRIMRYEDISAFLPKKNQLSGNRNFNTT